MSEKSPEQEISSTEAAAPAAAEAATEAEAVTTTTSHGGIPDPAPSSVKKSKSPVFNEQTNYLPTARVVAIFLACAGVDFVALMDQTTLAASLSIIGNELGASSKNAWISGGYFLTSTAFQLIYGRLSDIWSRKVVLLVGFAIFFFGSLASSLARTVSQLIAFRAITGVGGGGLMTIAQMIVSDVVPLRERGKYQGIFGAFVALANGIGPVIGGALAQKDWRWIFRLNLPLTLITVIGVMFFMPLKPVEGHWKTKLKSVDFVGVGTALSGSTLLVLGLTWAGGDYEWDTYEVILTMTLGCALLVSFFFWQWKGARLPLVPLHIFKRKVVNGASLTMFINGWNFVVQVYYIPTFYQLVYGYSAVRAGAMLLPITLMQTFSSTLSGLLITWTGRYRENILVGWAVWTIGLGLFSTTDKNSGLGKQIGYALLTGFGVGQTLQPCLIAIQAGVDRKDMAVVTSFRNFIRNLGSTLGLAVAGTVINNTLRNALIDAGVPESELAELLDNPTRAVKSMQRRKRADTGADIGPVIVAAYKKGFRTIFLIMTGLSAVAFILALFLMPQVELNRKDEAKLKEEGKQFDKALRERKKSYGIKMGSVEVITQGGPGESRTA